MFYMTNYPELKNMTKKDGSKEDLVKIIRDDSLGSIAWDSNGVNDW